MQKYAFANTWLNVLEIIAWIAMVSGVLLALIGLGEGNLFGRFSLSLALLGALPGLALALSGVLSMVAVQFADALIDTAETNAEMLALMRGQRGIIPNNSEPTSELNKLEMGDAYSAEKEREGLIVLNARGTKMSYRKEIVDFNKGDVSYQFQGKNWHDPEELKDHIDALLDGKLEYKKPRAAEVKTASKAPERQLPQPENTCLAETYKGFDIQQNHDGFYVGDNFFPNLSEARRFIGKSFMPGNN